MITRLTGSGCEHLLEDSEGPAQRNWGEPGKPSHKAIAINCPNLVKHDVACPPGETARNAKAVDVAPGSHGGHNERIEISVEIVGRHHYARARLPNLAAPRRIEAYQEHVTSTDGLHGHHVHSVSSKRVSVGGSSNASSLRMRNLFAASLQPERGRAALAITMAPFWTRNSTSSLRPASRMSGLGSRTPREFPMRTKRVFMTVAPFEWDYIVITHVFGVKRCALCVTGNPGCRRWARPPKVGGARRGRRSGGPRPAGTPAG